MLKKLYLASLIAVTAFSFQVSADNSISNEQIKNVSRYVTLMPKATKAQRNPMKGIINRVHFRNNIKTVGQAIQNILKDSGFRLTRYHPEKRVHKMFSLRLPNIHRNMGPISLENTLEVLAGEPWELSVDPINRLVSFELPLDYKDEKELKRLKEFEQYRLLLDKKYQALLKTNKNNKKK